MTAQNSEIDRVKRAVCKGYRTRKAIARYAGLTVDAAGTYLTRLIGRGLVETVKNERGTQYHMKDMGLLLQRIWGKV